MSLCTIPPNAGIEGNPQENQCPDESSYNPSNIPGTGTSNPGSTAGSRGIVFGNDIFDAISGAPGTYLTYDTYGHIGFGFSPELWTATLNMIDSSGVPRSPTETLFQLIPHLDFKW